MLVEDVMQRQLTTVGPATTLPEALRLAKARGVRHHYLLERVTMAEIMTRGVINPGPAIRRLEARAYAVRRPGRG